MVDMDMRNNLQGSWLRIGGWSLIAGGFLGVMPWLWFMLVPLIGTLVIGQLWTRSLFLGG